MAKKKTHRKDYSDMRCPYCGRTVKYVTADQIYDNGDKNQYMLVCTGYPECDAYVRCQTGTRIPLGSLANKELRIKRIEAHRCFDKLFKQHIMEKQRAYEWLKQISYDGQGHIACMGITGCNNVIREVNKVLNGENVIRHNKKRGVTA